jgi:hypothetical protein
MPYTRISGLKFLQVKKGWGAAGELDLELIRSLKGEQ